MIFSGTSPDGRKHIDLIFSGDKTQTRRPTSRYQVGKNYAVQAKRTAKADTRGRIKIVNKALETKKCPICGEPDCWMATIEEDDAKAEGGYDPEQYEALYEKMYPGWTARQVYIFEVVR